MKNMLLVSSLFGILIVCLLSAPLCSAQTINSYHSSEGHFFFLIPDGREEFSKEQLSEIVAAMNQLPGTKTELETGFIEKGQTGRYLLIQITP